MTDQPNAINIVISGPQGTGKSAVLADFLGLIVLDQTPQTVICSEGKSIFVGTFAGRPVYATVTDLPLKLNLPPPPLRINDPVKVLNDMMGKVASIRNDGQVEVQLAEAVYTGITAIVLPADKVERISSSEKS